MKNKSIATLRNGLLVIDEVIIFAVTRSHYAARNCDELGLTQKKLVKLTISMEA